MSLQAVRAAAPPGWNDIVPCVIGFDPAPDWVLESRCVGIDARGAVEQPDELDRLLDDLSDQMCTLYRATSGVTFVDDDRFAMLVDRPLSATKLIAASRLRSLVDARSLDRARAELREQLAGRALTTSFVHGNLWLGNVLWTPETGVVSGIVDWVRTTPGFPVVDIVHLACSTRALEEHREIGAVVRELLEGSDWPEREARLLRSVPGADEISSRAAILLAWMQHIAGKGQGAFESNVWMAHNVYQVLENV